MTANNLYQAQSPKWSLDSEGAHVEAWTSCGQRLARALTFHVDVDDGSRTLLASGSEHDLVSCRVVSEESDDRCPPGATAVVSGQDGRQSEVATADDLGRFTDALLVAHSIVRLMKGKRTPQDMRSAQTLADMLHQQLGAVVRAAQPVRGFRDRAGARRRVPHPASSGPAAATAGTPPDQFPMSPPRRPKERYLRALTRQTSTIPDWRDALVKVTACAICRPSLHLDDDVIPTMKKGDVVGHQTRGEVVSATG